MRASAFSYFWMASRNIEYPSEPPPSPPTSAGPTSTAKESEESARSSQETMTCASTVPSARAIAAGQNTRNFPASASTSSRGSQPRTRSSRWRHSR